LSDGTKVTLKPVLSDAGSVIEVEQGLSNPARPDTDRDGLWDADEWRLETEVYQSDTDEDDLSDGKEVHDVETNPRIWDTDNDGYSDGSEGTIEVGQSAETTEVYINLLKPDTDGDGLSDTNEVVQRLRLSTPVLESDPQSVDTDGDGLTDREETNAGTDLDDRDTDGDDRIDGNDPKPNVRCPDEGPVREQSFVNDAGALTEEAALGAIFGEAGIVYSDGVASVVNVDEVPANFEEKDTESLDYFAGWLALSVAPEADVFADSRDCVVASGEIVFDGLDCAGAGISLLSKFGKAGGIATLPTGSGGVLLAGSAAADVSEDAITDVAVISARAIENGQSAERIARFVIIKTDISGDEFASRVIPRLDSTYDKQTVQRVADVAEEFRRLDKFDSLSRDQAYALAKVVDGTRIGADAVGQIASRINHFDDLPYSSQGYLVEQLAKRGDSVQAAGRLGNLNTETLRTITAQQQVGKAAELLADFEDGGALLQSLRSGDNGRRTLEQFLSLESAQLQRVKDLSKSGKMDQADVNRMLVMLDEASQRPLIDEAADADDLLKIADEGDLSTTQLVVKNENGETRWLQDGIFAPDSNTKSRGWNYIKSRHIDGDGSKPATDFWPLGREAHGKELPQTMTEDGVKRYIYEAIENSQSSSQDKFVYEGYSSTLVKQTGIDSIEVVISNNRIRTAYPQGGDNAWRYVSEGDYGWIKADNA
jgi:hypothetical protein